jgi:hypothetical protein
MKKKYAIVGGGNVGLFLANYLLKKGVSVTVFTSSKKPRVKILNNNILGGFKLHTNRYGSYSVWGGVIAIDHKIAKLFSEKFLLEFISSFNIIELYAFKNESYFFHAKIEFDLALKELNIIEKEVSTIDIETGRFIISGNAYDVCILSTGAYTVPEVSDEGKIALTKSKIIFDKYIELVERKSTNRIDFSRLFQENELVAMDIPVDLPLSISDRQETSSFYHILNKSYLLPSYQKIKYILHLSTYLKIAYNILTHRREKYWFRTISLKNSYPINYQWKGGKFIGEVDKSIKNRNGVKMYAYHYESRIKKDLEIKNLHYEHLLINAPITHSNPVALRILKILFELKYEKKKFADYYL